MPSYQEPYTVWYLEEEEAHGEFTTVDGRRLELDGDQGRLPAEETGGRDLVEATLRWKGHAVPGTLERKYGIDADDVVNHLETLEEEGICYSKEMPGSYSYAIGF